MKIILCKKRNFIVVIKNVIVTCNKVQRYSNNIKYHNYLCAIKPKSILITQKFKYLCATKCKIIVAIITQLLIRNKAQLYSKNIKM